ncbi:MAG: NnrS family protein [Pseudomonadales bacterium]|nr:NnrS family protein [Pseudomonadales bacterium]MDP6471274.1 NnrS family protein [Pseudomonadales bacterium]MDP6825537.1 NnrS family protein [Pseudomonadales bacterium]MDP6973317.1 NnrS family protein [Pseudomonadales bacterium]
MLKLIFSGGFRPFFLGAGVFACASMGAWMVALRGVVVPADGVVPLLWHGHELVFGYAAAVLAGFLFTALPNWTRTESVSGASLVAWFVLWCAARLANVMFPPLLLTGAIDCLFLLSLALHLWIRILHARNYRNLGVAVAVTLMGAANVLWYVEVIVDGYPSYGVRFGLACVVWMLCLIGGRLASNFTRNWLRARGHERLPAAPGRLDLYALGLSAAALLAWVMAPHDVLSGWALVAAGALNLVRLSRWCGLATREEILLAVLHVGYLWLSLALTLLGVEILAPSVFAAGTGLHALTAGAVGLMTVAVMTRASLGHTGRQLTADTLTTAVYLLIGVSALLRMAAPYLPGAAAQPQLVAGMVWCAGFAAFAVGYGRYLLSPRVS